MRGRSAPEGRRGGERAPAAGGGRRKSRGGRARERRRRGNGGGWSWGCGWRHGGAGLFVRGECCAGDRHGAWRASGTNESRGKCARLMHAKPSVFLPLGAPTQKTRSLAFSLSSALTLLPASHSPYAPPYARGTYASRIKRAPFISASPSPPTDQQHRRTPAPEGAVAVAAVRAVPGATAPPAAVERAKP